ncbi:unnamed protein product [Brachionus calyciflorus]|uniref:Protein-tyrosine sulfotransferase n=1 Tax=Brachionus calyciflorus TaxID=104777 RepID=A0A813M2K2_9BILA|nr:unnamed protein product [Brachionus calyciflorus]
MFFQKSFFKAFLIILLCDSILYFNIKESEKRGHDEIKHEKLDLSENKNDLDEIFQEPLIFIGGYVSSGTSLMRSILDVHPDVKCGPEIKIPNMFAQVEKLRENEIIKNATESAGLDDTILKRALGLYSYYIFLNNVDNAKRLCSKEPFNLNYIEFFKSVFPKSKFILIVRDGREAAFSVIKRWYGEKYEFENFLKFLSEWESWYEISYPQCVRTGRDYCKIVRYENLVRNPRETIKEIAHFLDLEWTDKFLKHYEFLDKDIKVSKNEPSLYGLKNEINTKSLGNWIGNIKNYDEKKIREKIKMLEFFGYL